MLQHDLVLLEHVRVRGLFQDWVAVRAVAGHGQEVELDKVKGLVIPTKKGLFYEYS